MRFDSASANLLRLRTLAILLTCGITVAACDSDGGVSQRGTPNDPTPPAPTTVTVSGVVDDGTPTSPVPNAMCELVDLDGAQILTFSADGDGEFEIDVEPGIEGVVNCWPPMQPELRISKYVSTVGASAGDTITDRDVLPLSTVVVRQLLLARGADPETDLSALEAELIAAIADGSDADLALLADAATILFDRIVAAGTDVPFAGALNDLLEDGVLDEPALADIAADVATAVAEAETARGRTLTAALTEKVPPLTLTVLHNNDGESQLIDSGDPDFGGVARFKTLVDDLRDAGNTDGATILLTSGDNFLAGPEFSASLEKGVPFFDSIALDAIGYDAFALGNHDFDFGPDVLAQFISGFETDAPFLSVNLDFSAEDVLQALVDEGRIAGSTILDVKGYAVGVVGATTPNLPFISSPRGVVVDDDVAGLVQAEVDTLIGRGASIVILISHLQSVLEDQALAAELTGIDLMIAGGGDELLANEDTVLIPGDEEDVFGPYPILVSDGDGNELPIVTTTGDYKYVGRLVATFDAAGRITEIDAGSGPVRVSGVGDDAVEADADLLAAVVTPVQEALADLEENVLAQSEVALDGTRGSIRTEETDLGNLIADAFLTRGTALAGTFGVDAPTVALGNGGGIRNNDVIAAGPITELDTFDILPFGNFLTIVPDVPAAQFKEILENAVSRVEFTDGRFAQIGGFTMVYDPTGTAQLLDENGEVTPPGTRVLDVTLDDGTVLVSGGVVAGDAPSVDIATVDFLARGGDQYPYRGAAFTTLGISYQRALADYIVDDLGGVIAAADYPEGGSGRISAGMGVATITGTVLGGANGEGYVCSVFSIEDDGEAFDSAMADADGVYSLEMPTNRDAVVECAPPMQAGVTLLDFVSTVGVLPDTTVGGQDVDTASTLIALIVRESLGLDPEADGNLIEADQQALLGGFEVELDQIGRYEANVFDDGAAEIVAFDPGTDRLFVINAGDSEVDVLDASDPTDLELLGSVSLFDILGEAAADFDGFNSVDVADGIVAVAIEFDGIGRGRIGFFASDVDLEAFAPLGSAEAGFLPDRVTFTPDGTKVLVANEGEPSDDYQQDPEGSVTIVEITSVEPFTTMVTEVGFTDFNDGGSRAAEVPAGLRLFGGTTPIAVSTPDEDLLLDDAGDAALISVGDFLTIPEQDKGDPVVFQVTDIDMGEGVVLILDESLSIEPSVAYLHDRSSTVAQDLEPEYIAVSDDGTTAYVTLQENNGIAVIDIAAGTVTKLIALGTKDHSQIANAFDASDRDGEEGGPGVNIRTWPVRGFYMPDSIDTFTTMDGTTWIVTANEGDAREYDGLVEERRIKDIVLDPTAFPNAEALQEDDALGRLTTSIFDGDTDGDGDFDELYAFGARSFTIFDTDGNVVFDSGSDFERITALRYGEDFNNDNTEDDGDSRSDAKGPEPEAIVVGEVGDRIYTFIGLERMGGIMVYDVTEPASARFVEYFNNRIIDGFSESQIRDIIEEGGGASVTGDLGPEGFEFVAIGASPTGVPLLAVGNEVTGTTTVYTVTEVEATAGANELAALLDYVDGLFSLVLASGDDVPFEDLIEDGLDGTVDADIDGELAADIEDLVDEIEFDRAITLLDAIARTFPEIELTVLHNNDGESQLIDSGDEDFGGVARFKTLIDQLRALGNETGRTLVLSSGDNFLAGPEFSASLEKGVPFFDSIALDAVGYDALAIGNHEFDFGPDVLADFIGGISDAPFLSANLDVSGEPALAALETAGRIAPSTVIEFPGFSVGVVGATTPRLPFISSPRDVVVLADVAEIVQDEIDRLQEEEDVRIVILISHLQSIAEDQELIPMLEGVDIAIAGGGDEEEVSGSYPLYAPGSTVPIITTTGAYRYVGRLVARFDVLGRLIEVDMLSGPVRVAGGDNPDAVTPDATLQATVVDPVQAAIDDRDQNVIANSEVVLDGRRSQVRTTETNQGNLIADAFLARATALAPDFGADIPVVALANGGGIRNDAEIAAGDITELDTFDMLPFGNFLTIVEDISASRFKEILENAVSRVEFTDGRFAQVAGFTFTYDPLAPARTLDDDGFVTQAGSRILDVTLDDGTVVVDNGAVQMVDPIAIATVDFLARGGDNYPFADLGEDPSIVLLGESYQRTLATYIQDDLAGEITAEDYPEGGEGRITETPAWMVIEIVPE